MADCNMVILIGNLGDDPDIRTFQSGDKVANFTLATSRKWKDKSGEWKEFTEWHRIAVTNQFLVKALEERAQKGTRITLQGELRTRKWEDSNGATRYTTEVHVPPFRGWIDITLRARGDSTQAQDSNDYVPDDDDDIPF